MSAPPDDQVLDGRILVVDDEEANIRLIERALASTGFRHVRATTDPRTVLSMLADEPADIVALDLMMPHMDGFELMHELQASDGRSLPILVLTADASVPTKRRALEAGASDFLVKPLDPLEVGMRIKNLLRMHLLRAELHDQNEQLERRVRERTAELERLATEMDELNRTKSEIIQVLAHELFTPITAIQATALTITRRDVELPTEEVDDLIDGMVRATERVRRLIRNLTVAAMLERDGVQLERTTVPFAAIIDVVAKEFPYNRDRIQLDPADRDVELFVNSQLVTRALAIVVENAVLLAPRETSIEIAVRSEDAMIAVDVADHGPGVPPERVSQIFHAFVQTEPSMTRRHEGLGLGLYLARRIARLHGGDITVQDRTGGGSVFTLRFPAPSADDVPLRPTG